MLELEMKELQNSSSLVHTILDSNFEFIETVAQMHDQKDAGIKMVENQYFT